MLEDSFVSFFPKRPEKETWNDSPEKVENGAIVRALWPMAQYAGAVPLGFASLTLKADFVPELAG